MYVSNLINKLLELKDIAGDIEVRIEDVDFFETGIEYVELINYKTKESRICLFAHKKYLPPIRK